MSCTRTDTHARFRHVICILLSSSFFTQFSQHTLDIRHPAPCGSATNTPPK